MAAHERRPIFLYTDFGSADLYVGQVKAVLHAAGARIAPSSIFSTTRRAFRHRGERAPSRRAGAAAAGGRGHDRRRRSRRRRSDRDAVALEADGRWFVGPDNGLLSVLAARSRRRACTPSTGWPQPRSASFHGRDLFAPAAARIATRRRRLRAASHRSRASTSSSTPAISQVVYVDHYGNAMTGCARSARRMPVESGAHRHARVFSMSARRAFWYENSIGLVEIAANQASAAALLGSRSARTSACARDLYDRPRQPAARGAHRSCELRVGVSSTCARFPARGAIPTSAAELERRCRAASNMWEGTPRRAAPAARRFAARSAAQRELSRVRRSHGKRRVPRRRRAPARARRDRSASRSCAPSACRGSAIAT